MSGIDTALMTMLVVFLAICLVMGLLLEAYGKGTMTKCEFHELLEDIYGDRIDLGSATLGEPLTQKYAIETLHLVSLQLGHEVVWSGGEPSAMVTRNKATEYIALMICCSNGALKPRKK